MLQEKMNKSISPQEAQVQQVLALEEKEVLADGVFGGGEREGQVNYNTVGWVGTSVLLMKTQVRRLLRVLPPLSRLTRATRTDRPRGPLPSLRPQRLRSCSRSFHHYRSSNNYYLE